MNKRILILLVILTVCVSVLVGCLKATGQEDSETSVSIIQSEGMDDEPTPSDRDQNAVDEDASELIGKVDEIKENFLKFFLKEGLSTPILRNSRLNMRKNGQIHTNPHEATFYAILYWLLK